MDELDSLHQRASAHYLQGNAEDALAAWERLLKLAPADDRALEGIRLCRDMLHVGESDAEAPGDDVSPLAAAFAALDEKLSLENPGEPTEPSPGTNDPGERGMDLAWSLEDDSTSDAPATDDAAPAHAAPPPAMTGWEWDADAPPAGPAGVELPARIAVALAPAESPSPAVEIPAAEVERNAALELRRRANELLAHALAAMEAGSHDEALRTLDRVLILDDTNEAARSLKAKIAEEAVIAGPARGSAPRAAHSSGPQEVELEQGDRRTIELDLPALAEGAGDPPAAPQDSTAAEAPPRARPAAVEQPTSAKVSSFAAWRVDLRSWPVIAAAVAVGLGALLYYLSGVGASPAVPPSEMPRVPTRAAGAGDATTSPAERRAEGAAQEPAAASDTPDAAKSLARANAAFEAGDYAAAIVGYNEVLKVDPAHAAAAFRLKEAGSRYREVRLARARWDQARQAFETGDYREALRQFYRLPPGEDAELVARYKVNGWYNLGVQALGSGNCQEALANFEDAQEIQQSEEGLAEVLQLARSCSRDPKSRQLPVRLPLRALDD